MKIPIGSRRAYGNALKCCEEIEGKISPGLFERAHGGTLFFDEVAELPIGTQAKILRVLVDQVFTRVGGKNIVRVNCRIIS